jgi:hypothetical protein
LRVRKQLKGSNWFLDKDLTPNKLEERRKEWEKVKEARQHGKWAILWNKQTKVDIFWNVAKKYGELTLVTHENIKVVIWSCQGYPWRRG